MTGNPYSAFLAKLAKDRGLKIKRLDPLGNFYLFSQGKKNRLVLGGVLSDQSGAASALIAKNKYATIALLKAGGFPTALNKYCHHLAEAQKFLRQHRRVVVKPLSSKQGKNISVDITTPQALRQAIKLINKKSFLVEKMLVGRDYRLLVINYQKVYSILRLPAYVVGDGQQTVSQLIDQKNQAKLIYKVEIPKDALTKKFLKEQHLTLTSRPVKDRIIYLRKTANLHTGGTTVDVTDQLPARIKAQAVAVAKFLNLAVVGIDVISPDIKKSFGRIIEVNADPGLRIHHFPHFGRAQQPGQDILDQLFGPIKKS